MENKRKLPEKFLADGIALAEDASIFGVKLSELSRDELLAVAAKGWKAHQELLADNASRSRLFRPE